MTIAIRAGSAAAWLIAFTLLAGVGAVDASAQSLPQQTPSDSALPALPDGFVVTPARPIIPLPRFEFQHKVPDPGALDSPSSPNSQPLGGCRYEERELELLV